MKFPDDQLLSPAVTFARLFAWFGRKNGPDELSGPCVMEAQSFNRTMINYRPSAR